MPSRAVSIADLKDNLSRYLLRVRAGEQITIRDRNVPIAKIVPLVEMSSERASLVAEGQLRAGAGSLPRDFWRLPAPRIAAAAVLAALDAERED
ncbi:MAG: type II toxin-antitoxin system prevent-host-death family antitoxin [Polyangiaceae bacterium]